MITVVVGDVSRSVMKRKFGRYTKILDASTDGITEFCSHALKSTDLIRVLADDGTSTYHTAGDDIAIALSSSYLSEDAVLKTAVFIEVAGGLGLDTQVLVADKTIMVELKQNWLDRWPAIQEYEEA